MGLGFVRELPRPFAQNPKPMRPTTFETLISDQRDRIKLNNEINENANHIIHYINDCNGIRE